MGYEDKKKKSTLLLIVVLVFSIGLYLILNFFSVNGQMAIVTVDGEVVKEMPLETDDEFVVKGFEGGENRIVVKSGKCFVSYADCPDKLCVNQGEISKDGEAIICLPHRVVVKISSKNGDNAIDSIAK